MQCNQAVYEANGDGQCWTGSGRMTQQPTSSRSGCKPGPCVDSCFAKSKTIANVSIHEQKFIASNDVVSTTITASTPVLIEISGRSFANVDNAAGKVLSLNGQCSVDKATNTIRIIEAGTVSAHVYNRPVRKSLATKNLLADTGGLRRPPF